MGELRATTAVACSVHNEINDTSDRSAAGIAAHEHAVPLSVACITLCGSPAAAGHGLS